MASMSDFIVICSWEIHLFIWVRKAAYKLPGTKRYPNHDHACEPDWTEYPSTIRYPNLSRLADNDPSGLGKHWKLSPGLRAEAVISGERLPDGLTGGDWSTTMWSMSWR